VGERVLNVLFLCTGNSARSILAEAQLNRLGNGKFRAYSAGSRPTGKVHPLAIALLKNSRIDVSGLRSKSWDEFSRPGAPQMDFVFTVCDEAAREECPVWPGYPMTAHWGVPDPSKATGNESQIALAFADAFKMLTARIAVFVSLPFVKLERLSLQARLDRIGAMDRPERKTSAVA
jgi:arsenate reductase